MLPGRSLLCSWLDNTVDDLKNHKLEEFLEPADLPLFQRLLADTFSAAPNTTNLRRPAVELRLLCKQQQPQWLHMSITMATTFGLRSSLIVNTIVSATTYW